MNTGSAPTASAAKVSRGESDELRELINLIPLAIVRIDADERIAMLNARAAQLLHELGIDAAASDASAIVERLAPGLSARWRAAGDKLGEVLPPLRCDPLRSNGRVLNLQLRMIRPNPHSTMLAIEDLGAVVEHERAFARERSRFGIVLDQIHGSCVAMLDSAGTIVEWNPSILHVFGIDLGDFVAGPLLGWIAADTKGADAIPRFEDIQAAVGGPAWCRLHLPWRRPDGQLFWGDSVITPLVESDGSTSGYIVVIRDLTDQRRQNQILLDAALTDPLTGLYNRRGLHERVDQTLKREGGAPLVQAWIMIDIDHFKLVNDRYGHHCGDDVIKGVAAALTKVARETDTLVRLGGEEFAVLLPDATEQVARRVAERLRETVEAMTVECDGDEVRVTASFGVAQQSGAELFPAALGRADAALYRAKRDGRNRIIVWDATIGSHAKQV